LVVLLRLIQKDYIKFQKINSKSYQIQSWEDVDPAWLKDVDTIGITAGASTPNELILEVKTI